MQVNQTIQFYRTQQGGGVPQRVYLCGGGSVMAYSAEFFQEKLNLPVEYFSPFRNVAIDPAVNVEELEKSASCLGEVVGLGLRNIADCPIEMNLMPRSSRSRQEFNSKKPYLLAAAFIAASGVWAAGLFYSEVADARRVGRKTIDEKVDPLAQVETRLKGEEEKLKGLRGQADQISEWLHDRTYWADILAEVRRVLKSAEETGRQKLGVPVGIWVDTFYSTEPAQSAAEVAQQEEGPRYVSMDINLLRRYGLIPKNAPGGEGSGEGSGEGGAAKPKAKSSNSTNEVAVINVTVRAVNLQKVKQEANSQLAYDLEKEAKASPLFDASETSLSGNLEQVDDAASSFTFPLKLKLKRPIKL
jgi:hypothetical protein